MAAPTTGAAVAETGRYLYAVSRDLDPRALDGLTGLGGGHLDLVEHQGLVAVVSTVDLEEYGEEGLRRNLEDLAWLETAARGHDAVIHAVATAAPTAPLRLATICLDDAGVRLRLREWHSALVQVLDRVEGRSEWSVKVFTRPADPALAGADVGAGGPEPAPTGGGAAYLRRKKAEAQAREVGEEAAINAATEVHDGLSACAVASRRLQAQDPRLSGHEGTMVLNGAYLVDVSEEAEFARELDRLVETHPQVSIDRRGPWPPYSFAMLEQR